MHDSAVISGADVLMREVGEAQIRYTLYLPLNSVYFKGHFPGRPILPGITQINWAISLLQPLLVVNEIKSLDRVKFMRPIRPDSKISLLLKLSNDDHRFSYRFFDDSGVFSSGQVTFG